jgi:hypothetical protein
MKKELLGNLRGLIDKKYLLIEKGMVILIDFI